LIESAKEESKHDHGFGGFIDVVKIDIRAK